MLRRRDGGQDLLLDKANRVAAAALGAPERRPVGVRVRDPGDVGAAREPAHGRMAGDAGGDTGHAVHAPQKADHLRPLAGHREELGDPVIGVRAAEAEANFAMHRLGRRDDFEQALGELNCSRVGERGEAGERKLLHRGRDRVDHHTVGVAGGGDGPAACEVDVTLAVRVGDRRARSAGGRGEEEPHLVRSPDVTLVLLKQPLGLGLRLFKRHVGVASLLADFPTQMP